MAIGITVAYAPQAVPEWFAVEELGPWMRALALIPLGMGLVFFLGASRFHLSLYLRIIGALAILKGLFYLIVPTSYSVAFTAWYLGLPAWYLRLSGFVTVGLALVIAVVAVISLFEEDVI